MDDLIFDITDIHVDINLEAGRYTGTVTIPSNRIPETILKGATQGVAQRLKELRKEMNFDVLEGRIKHLQNDIANLKRERSAIQDSLEFKRRAWHSATELNGEPNGQ
jgi:hypothetical protein